MDVIDLAPLNLPPPDRQLLADIDWSEAAALWNENRLDELHDWLNERWSRLVRNSMLASKDPEAELLQGLAYAALAFYFTQHRNQDGALMLLDDAVMMLAKYRPAFLGVHVDPLVDALSQLRPLLLTLAPTDECPLYPFVLPKFTWTA